MNSEKINLQYTTITTPLPDFIYVGLKAYSRNANAYMPQPTELIGKLSKKHTIPEEMICLTAGADEAIQMFALAYGRKTYFFTPTYVVYADTTDFFTNVTGVNALKNNEYKIPTDKITDATLIYLANPNNPCGYTTQEKIIELVKNNPQAIIVVDEVYAEFTNLSIIEYVNKYPNLAVLRSFSKSYGMAGNRIGFIVANPNIIKKVKTKTQWSNVSYLSVGAAITALDHEDYFQEMREDINQRRDDLSSFLKKKGYIVLHSKINAVLVKFSTEEKGTKFAQYMVDNNIAISHGNGNSNVGLDKSYIRISIGSKKDMEKIKEVINKYNQ